MEQFRCMLNKQQPSWFYWHGDYDRSPDGNVMSLTTHLQKINKLDGTIWGHVMKMQIYQRGGGGGGGGGGGNQEKTTGGIKYFCPITSNKLNKPHGTIWVHVMEMQKKTISKGEQIHKKQRWCNTASLAFRMENTKVSTASYQAWFACVTAHARGRRDVCCSCSTSTTGSTWVVWSVLSFFVVSSVTLLSSSSFSSTSSSFTSLSSPSFCSVSFFSSFVFGFLLIFFLFSLLRLWKHVNVIFLEAIWHWQMCTHFKFVWSIK